MTPAVVLLSGGLDSTTTLAVARDRGFDVHALTLDYGQRHRHELDSALRVARHYGVADHRIFALDLRQFGGSALTSNVAVPKGRALTEMNQAIPVTYVPGRNTIFLSIALAWAEVLGSVDLFTGVNALDYSGYPDCRPEYVAAFEQLANLATKAGVSGRHLTVHAPLIALGKAEIVQLGAQLAAPFHLTSSCYDPDIQGRACGRCDTCILRLKGFKDAGLVDPIAYLDEEAS